MVVDKVGGIVWKPVTNVKVGDGEAVREWSSEG